MSDTRKDMPLSFRCSDEEQLRETITQLLGQARRQIVIFAPRLRSQLFNTAAVSDALTHFAAVHRHNLARIAVEDSQQVLRNNPRLAELCRRYSSFIKLQRVGEEHKGLSELFMVIDHATCLHQPDMEKSVALVDAENKPRIAEFQRRFEQIWERSEPVSSLHPLGI